MILFQLSTSEQRQKNIVKNTHTPNILFIQVDQLTAKSLGAYGNQICRAPNLDRLASSGVTFDTAYSNFPLCAPSRFSMATGRLCSAIGAYDNAAEMPASIPTYAHYLSAAGYQTALSGKMHFIGPDQYHGFEKRLTPDLYPADFSWVPNWGDEGDRDTNDSSSVLVSGVCERSVQMDFDDLVTYHAIQYLYDKARSTDTRPFFLQVSYTHPHEPYLCQPEHWQRYEDADISLPDVPALPADQHDSHSVRLLSDFNMLDVRFADEDILRARRAYYGSISYLDDMIGRIQSVLESLGMADQTAIVFTSDHGEMLGERGMWFKKHFFEPALRVPLFIKFSDGPTGRVSTPVSLVDLLPTFMSIAQGPGWQSDTESLDGADLKSISLQPANPNRPVYAEYLAESTTAPIFMIRRGSYKYIESTEDEPLLFDVEKDPHERVNLAIDPVYAKLLATFRSEMAQKWNSAELSEQIKLSQRRRRLIVNGNTNSRKPRWNHGEKQDEDVVWYRGEQGYNQWAFAYLPVRKKTP